MTVYGSQLDAIQEQPNDETLPQGCLVGMVSFVLATIWFAVDVLVHTIDARLLPLICVILAGLLVWFESSVPGWIRPSKWVQPSVKTILGWNLILDLITVFFWRVMNPRLFNDMCVFFCFSPLLFVVLFAYVANSSGDHGVFSGT